jgi:hypothetical protein
MVPIERISVAIKDLKKTSDYTLYNINIFVFTTGTECVHCAVRTGPLNIIQVTLTPQRVKLASFFFMGMLETNLEYVCIFSLNVIWGFERKYVDLFQF